MNHQPNLENVTCYDMEKTKIFSTHTSESKMAFLWDGGTEVTIDSYEKETELYTGHYETINMFGSEPFSKVEGKFDFESVSFIPHGSVLNSYVEEIESCKASSECELVTAFKDKYKIDLSLSDDAVFLIEPTSLTGCIFDSKLTKPYIAILPDVNVMYDSLEACLKFAFEEARTVHNFMSKSTRKSLSKFQEYLDSDEFSERLDKEIENERNKTKELKVFFDDEFEKSLSKLKITMLEHGSRNVVLGDSFYSSDDIISLEDAGNLVECAFRFGECLNDDDADFKTEYVNISGFKFSRIYGQGMISVIELGD